MARESLRQHRKQESHPTILLQSGTRLEATYKTGNSKRRHTARMGDPPVRARRAGAADPPARMRHTANVGPFGDPSRVRHTSATGHFRNLKKPEKWKPGMVGAHIA